MAGKNESIFADESFPIRMDSNRQSSIDSVEDARRALHEAIEIKYFYEGSSTLLIGRNTVVARAGDVIVINPYEFHATVNDENRGKYHLFMISTDFFTGNDSDVPDLLHKLLSGQISFVTHLKGDKTLCRILSLLRGELEAQAPYFRIAVRGLATELLAHLLRYGIQHSPTDDSRAHAARHYAVVEPALRRIRDGYTEHLTVENLSMLCAVSKFHFCRVFKAVTGMTVMQYVNDYRLTIADAMIKNTDRTVSQISHLCGFEDESYFCRCYKKRFGYSAGKRRERETPHP